MFPDPLALADEKLTLPRSPLSVTKMFYRRVASLGFPILRLHDLRGTHETLQLDKGVPVHVVAGRCGLGNSFPELRQADQKG